MTPQRPRKILCFGEVAWDRSWTLTNLPQVSRDVDLLDECEGPGGCALNTAFILARAGVPVALAGNYIGEDSWGQNIHNYLNLHGIEDRVLSRPGRPTPFNQCLVSEKGQRTFIVSHQFLQDWHSDLLKELEPEIKASAFSQVFVQPYFQEGVRQLLPLLPEDCWVLAQEIESTSELVPHLHALQISLKESEVFSPSQIDQLGNEFFRGKMKDMIFTQGSRGVWHQARGSAPRFFPAEKVDTVVDTTGCGDAFRAGLMFGLFQGHNFIEAIKLGQKFGAIKAQHRGSHCPCVI